MNAVIAQHLNVAKSAIVKVEEWANVIFCVVRGLGARFVSKKVVKMNSLNRYASYSQAAQYLKDTGIWGDALPNTSIWAVLQKYINTHAWVAQSLDQAIDEVNEKLNELGLGEYTQARKLLGGPVAFGLIVNGFSFTFIS